MSQRPRRGLPPDAPNDPVDNVPDAETTAVRRALRDEELAAMTPPPAARRPSRAASEPEPEPTAAAEPEQTAPRRGRRAAAESEPAGAETVVVDSHASAEKSASRTRGLRAPRSQGGASTAPPRPALTAVEARRRRLALAFGLFGLIACLGIGLVPAQPAPVPQTVPLVTAISRTCPVSDTGPATLVASSSDGDIRLRELGSTATSTLTGPLSIGDQTTATILTPTLSESSVVGGTVMSSDTQQWYGSCRSPRTDQYVQLPGGDGATLLVINPESEDALIDITLTGPDGEITGDSLRGVTVPANSQHVVDLSAYAGSVDAVGARVRTSLGRVLAVAQAVRDDGGDFASNTILGRTVVIPAVPEGSGSTLLLLSNPGTTRNAVSIEAITSAGRYALPGYESYALNAQRTVQVDLTSALNGVPAALVITGREDFAASLFATAGGDFAVVPGELDEQSAAAQDLVAVVPGTGTLQITNSGDGEALVRVDWGEDQAPAARTVLAGSVATVDIPDGATTVRLTSNGPVSGALLVHSSSGSGLSAVPLEYSARSQAWIPIQPEAGMGR
ncbi:hypothetical protein GCM10009785_04290 [Brooklawnia cerclae]|uniref:Uncharacterized protein n=1 Tax=Brooklawnia cerclae TaxID=349934 RepID=A0ABX0SFL4_9ACTN|nr:DUF5719 family protein [Brooklawnia cerclae]NIH55980.1 hypothetical protein [Brooklawnia cerclae]